MALARSFIWLLIAWSAAAASIPAPQDQTQTSSAPSSKHHKRGSSSTATLKASHGTRKAKAQPSKQLRVSANSTRSDKDVAKRVRRLVSGTLLTPSHRALVVAPVGLTAEATTTAQSTAWKRLDEWLEGVGKLIDPRHRSHSRKSFDLKRPST